MLKLKFIIVYILTTCAFILKHNYAQSSNDCSTYKNSWYATKYPYDEELMKLTNLKSVSNICPKSVCCDIAMQNEMIAVGKIKLKDMTESHLKEITNFLFNTSDSLNDYLQTNIDQSKSELHQMFLSTYSTNYRSNQQFFFQFYDKLKLYMVGKEHNIEKILETFFYEMAERILNMMLTTRKDNETIRCLTTNFLKMDPYQNIDKAIVNNFKKTYPITRMFMNSLMAAQDVFEELLQKKMTPSTECIQRFAQVFHCPLCSATETMPCEGLCKSFYGKCFGSLNGKEMNKLSKAWKKLSGTLEKIGKLLKHPFNYVEMNKNLHVKISDAIMNVHNIFTSNQKKVWENCKVKSLRQRRSVDGNYNQYFQSLSKHQVNMMPKTVNLSPLIDKFSTKIQGMSQHLQKHKNTICSEKYNLPKPGKKCWNGLETTLNFKPESKAKSQNKLAKIDPLVQKLILRMNEIATTLNNLVTGSVKDPETFKINYVKHVNKFEASKSKSSRGSESIEGSGSGGDMEMSNGNAENNKEENRIPLTTKPPEVIEEGSGTKKEQDKNKNGSNLEKGKKENPKDRPSFPQIPTTNEKSSQKPKGGSSQKPVITDDEDLAQNQNENDKDNSKKPEKGSDPSIEGSGSEDSEQSTRPIKIYTTTTMSTIDVNKYKKNSNNNNRHKEPELPEGSGQSPDDESSETSTGFQSNTPTVYLPRKTTPENPSTTTLVFTNELPGDIPNEIWIPRIMDYDSNGKMIGNTNSKGSILSLFTLTVHLAWFSVSVFVYNAI